MDPQERATWDSEQWVIDRLVEAVELGVAEDKLRFARRLLDGYAKDGWRRRRMVDSGIIVLETDLDPRFADPGDAANAVDRAGGSQERYDQLAGGALLTNEEVSTWREYVTEIAFDDGLAYECHRSNLCVVLEVKHSDRRRAHLAVTHWDGQSGDLVAAYPTYTDALNALKNAGTVKMDSYLVWEEQDGEDSRYR